MNNCRKSEFIRSFDSWLVILSNIVANLIAQALISKIVKEKIMYLGEWRSGEKGENGIFDLWKRTHREVLVSGD